MSDIETAPLLVQERQSKSIAQAEIDEVFFARLSSQAKSCVELLRVALDSHDSILSDDPADRAGELTESTADIENPFAAV